MDRSQSVTSSAEEARWAEGPKGPLAWAVWLYATRPVLPSLALVAATGRALQVAWVEQHAPSVWLFEFIVEPARLLIAVAVVGAGHLGSGVHTLRKFWAHRHDDTSPSALAAVFEWSRIRKLSRSLLTALVAMAAFALVGNWLIGQVAQAPAALAFAGAVLGADAADAATAIILFLKNVSLIPIGIIWYGGLYRLLVHRSSP